MTQDDLSQSKMTQDVLSQPTLTQQELSPIRHHQYEAPEEDKGDGSNDDMHRDIMNNDICDVEDYCMQEDMEEDIMNHDVYYNRCYASESNDDGLEVEVDEEGFKAEEAKAFYKVVSRDHKTLLYHDLAHADDAVVDGGATIVLRPRPSSKRDMDHTKYGGFVKEKSLAHCWNSRYGSRSTR
jgi:hypothetical protein